MAVTGQEIDALRQQQEALSESLSRTQDALLQSRRQLAEENRAALERLQEETEKRVASREKQLKGSYEKLLGNAVSAQEAALAAEYSRMQQQYESVTGELNAALAQEQRQTEEMLLRQHEFEQAYYARQRFAGKRAEECRHKAERTVQETVAAAPVEWFFPGHLAIYNARLRELRNYYEKSVSSAAGSSIMRSCAASSAHSAGSCSRTPSACRQSLCGSPGAKTSSTGA